MNSIIEIILFGLVALFVAFGLVLWRVGELINRDLDRNTTIDEK